MENKLQLFENEEFGKVRVVEIDGQPWFVGKDVADALGYCNSRKALSDHVDAEDKGVTNCDTPGGKQKLAIINESGLYSLVLSSKLPTAKAFKRWVTSEILPSIRKHGAYMTDDLLDRLLHHPELVPTLLESLAQEQAKNEALEDTVDELAPKAQYHDLVLQCKSVMPVTLIAKDYGLSASGFNRLLHALGIQHKVGGTWILYQQYADCGYTATRTYYVGNGESRMYTCWTQRGRRFLYTKLAEYGIRPNQELLAGGVAQ